MCITDVQGWMEANSLKLNADETELFSELGLVRLSLVTVERHTIYEQRPSEPVTMCVCLESQYLLTSVLRNMFCIMLNILNTGSIRFVEEMEPGLRVTGQRVTGSAIWVQVGSGHESKP